MTSRGTRETIGRAYGDPAANPLPPHGILCIFFGHVFDRKEARVLFTQGKSSPASRSRSRRIAAISTNLLPTGATPHGALTLSGPPYPQIYDTSHAMALQH